MVDPADDDERRMREMAAKRAHLEDLTGLAGERALANLSKITEQLATAIAYVERAESLGADELSWCRWAVSQISANVGTTVSSGPTATA